VVGQLLMLIGQSDKMLTELKKVNEAESYLLCQWTDRSVVIIIKFLTLCFHYNLIQLFSLAHVLISGNLNFSK